MAEPAGNPVRQGEPRSDADAAFLERFDAAFRLPIIISAVLPLIVAPEPGKVVSVVIGVVTWLVFLVDYVVHLRRVQHFGRTGFGRFDLLIIVATAPWFLIPGAHGGSFVVLLRLARLGRIIMASKRSRQLFQRLGRVGIVAGGVLVTASLVAYYAEHPTNPEFATIGDALWWGIVTMTTVGYGDIVPKTATGRWAAVVIMLTGVAVLGLLAGSLASFFRLGQGARRGTTRLTATHRDLLPTQRPPSVPSWPRWHRSASRSHCCRNASLTRGILPVSSLLRHARTSPDLTRRSDGGPPSSSRVAPLSVGQLWAVRRGVPSID